MSALVLLACIVTIVVVGLPLAIWSTANIRRSKKTAAGFAIASALFLSFGLFNREAEKIAEVGEDQGRDARKRNSQSGDPPEP
ncbi:MAG TPA: hypothetical protein VMJ73_03570 [Rhizomicrobium sp.]|nr:hypothetical protein [Rhizomicrobium sp.]